MEKIPHFDELVKKAKGIDIGFLAVIIFFGIICGFISLINNETIRFFGFAMLMIGGIMVFDMYSQRKRHDYKQEQYS